MKRILPNPEEIEPKRQKPVCPDGGDDWKDVGCCNQSWVTKSSGSVQSCKPPLNAPEPETALKDFIDLTSICTEGVEAEDEEDFCEVVKSEDFCEVVDEPVTSDPAAADPSHVTAAVPFVWDLISDTSEDSGSEGLEELSGDAAAGAAPQVRKGWCHPILDLEEDSDVEFLPVADPGPSNACPGCQADNIDSVQQQYMDLAKRQLCAESSVVHLPQGTALGGPQFCSNCRRLAALAVVEAAQQEVGLLLHRHKTGGMVVRGFVFEVHHAASFNIEALRLGSPLRAERVEQDSADIRIYHAGSPAVTLAMAQLKASNSKKVLTKLNKLKYARHLKIVPCGFESSRRSSTVSYSGISSTAITLMDLEEAVRLPGDHFFKLIW